MWLLHLAFLRPSFTAAASEPEPESESAAFGSPNGNSCASETMHMWRDARASALGGIFDGWCSVALLFPQLEQTILHRGPCKANAKRSEHEARYGPIAQWDVSDVTDLNFVLREPGANFHFNQTSQGGMSRVTAMMQTFASAAYLMEMLTVGMSPT